MAAAATCALGAGGGPYGWNGAGLGPMEPREGPYVEGGGAGPTVGAVRVTVAGTWPLEQSEIL